MIARQLSTENDLRFQNVSERQIVVTDRLHKRDGTKTGIVLCTEHTAVPQDFLEPPYRNFIEELSKVGPVAIGTTKVNGVDGVSWGNDDSRTTVEALRFFYLQPPNVYGCNPDRIFVVGRSMGALQALNYTYIKQAEVAGVALVMPALDQQDLHARNVAGATAEMNAAFGSAGAWSASLWWSSPTYFAQYIEVPVRIWYAEDDPVALAYFVDYFVDTAPNASKVSLGNIGHDLTVQIGDEVADWLATL